MALDRRAIDQLRTALELNTSSAATSSLLFEALAEWEGPVPSTQEALQQLIQGPLTEVLIRRRGPAEAKRLLEAVLHGLAHAADAPTSREQERQPDTRSERDRDTTQAVPIATDPVEVAVLGSGDQFAHRLLAVLGPRRICSRPVSTSKGLRELAPIPALIVIDSQDFPASEPQEIADVVRTLPSTTATLLWAAHLPYGRVVMDTFKQQGLAIVQLTQEHGIAPLLDLIRSRLRI